MNTVASKTLKARRDTIHPLSFVSFSHLQHASACTPFSSFPPLYSSAITEKSERCMCGVLLLLLLLVLLLMLLLLLTLLLLLRTVLGGGDERSRKRGAW